MPENAPRDVWPELPPYSAWRDTCDTLHLWTQVVGKVRLALTPWLNHSWHVPLYVTARGLTTSPIPYGGRVFEIGFDFHDQLLAITTGEGARKEIALEAGSIAGFYAAVMARLKELGLDVSITNLPCEIPKPVPFDRDQTYRRYDGAEALRFWRALVQADRVMKRFRTGFIGKASPVHFFWGSFDLAVTRFSGRKAPPHPGGAPGLDDKVMREAYSHEVSSAGFWPGGGGIDDAAFYSYAYPVPEGFQSSRVEPEGTYYSQALGEFVLPYPVVRAAADPDAALLAFLQSTYEAAAIAGKWDRAALETPLGVPGVPRQV